jgi:nucleoside-diphosphate-sugar epimerase
MSATTVRPFNVYGLVKRVRALSAISGRLTRGEPIEVCGGSDVRSWCYVKDLVMAIDSLITRARSARPLTLARSGVARIRRD